MRELEALVAVHCAATLLGEKTGSMFTIRWPRYRRLRGGIGALRALLARRNMALRVLAAPGGAFVYVFRPEKLRDDLAAAPARTILARCGYGANALASLQRRLLACRAFPHEIGLFLGYPPRDVAGFIEHGGAGALLCGQWKVYHDAERAQCLFCAYRQCRERMLSLFEGGMSLKEILDAA